MSIASMVESLTCAAGCSMRVAGVGRVVEIQLNDRCGKLRSVEWLNAAGRMLQVVEVGRVW